MIFFRKLYNWEQKGNLAVPSFVIYVYLLTTSAGKQRLVNVNLI